uniref:hypothetical protein n=1 Tax=Halomonas halophila TaxID=29573 RepID=UPI0036D2CD12
MDAIAVNPTPSENGKRLRVYYGTQVSIQPPTFVIFVKRSGLNAFLVRTLLRK